MADYFTYVASVADLPQVEVVDILHKLILQRNSIMSVADLPHPSKFTNKIWHFFLNL